MTAAFPATGAPAGAGEHGRVPRVMAVPTAGEGVVAPSSRVPDACSYVRMVAPALTMPPGAQPDFYFGHPDLPLGAVRRCDVLWLNRTGLLATGNAAAVLDLVAREGKACVVDIDDALLDMDAAHVEALHYAALREKLAEVVAAASQITCSTEGVRQSVLKWFPEKDVVIVRNGINMRWFRSLPRPESPGEAEAVRICYYGTNTHAADWAMIEEQVLETALRYGDRVKVLLVGVISEAQAATYPQNVDVVSLPPQVSNVYPNFIQYLSRVLRPDVVLAPLERTPFNEAKSELKVVEALGLSMIPVYSAGFEYDRAAIDDGSLGMRVEREDGWGDALSRIVESLPDYRQAVASRRDAILADYDAASRAEDLLGLFRRVAA